MGAVIVDGAVLSAPYTVLAIGDGQTLDTALEIPGGIRGDDPRRRWHRCHQPAAQDRHQCCAGAAGPALCQASGR